MGAVIDRSNPEAAGIYSIQKMSPLPAGIEQLAAPTSWQVQSKVCPDGSMTTRNKLLGASSGPALPPRQ